jgi:DNA-binding MarR family transcriptional regulator
LVRFIRFSEGAARTAGITPKQYLLLLHICGTSGRDWASVGQLTERLPLSAHGTVALVKRCNAAHLVTKRRNGEDGRLVEVHATPLGRSDLLKPARALHEEEVHRETFFFRLKDQGSDWSIRPRRQAHRA